MLVASPICGWLIDRSPSRRLPFVLGLLAIGGSTVLLCVGSSISVLVLGRLLEGLSSALIFTCGPALLVDTVGQKEIGKATGYFSLCTNLAVLTGPVIGGAIFARSGYLAVFAMAFGLIGLDIVLRLALVEKKVAAKWSSTSNEEEGYWISNYNVEGPPNITLSSRWGCLDPLELPETTETDDSASSEINYQAISTAQATFHGSNHNFPPVITLLRSRRLLAALWGSLVQATIMCAFDAVLPLFVHRTFGWSSTGAGLIFLAICIPSFAAPLVGRMADKHGPRWLVAAGFTTSLPCLVLLRLVTHHTLQQIVLLCVLLFLLGTSLTFIMGPLVAEIAYLVKAKEEKIPGTFGTRGAYAQAFGLYYCWFAGGLLIGPIWAGYVEQRAGWGTMTWSLGLLSGVTAIPILVFTGGRHCARSGLG
jgi:MFS family permease